MVLARTHCHSWYRYGARGTRRARRKTLFIAEVYHPHSGRMVVYAFIFSPDTFYSTTPSASPTSFHRDKSSQRTGGNWFIYVPESQFSYIYVALKVSESTTTTCYRAGTSWGWSSFLRRLSWEGMYSKLYTHILDHHAEIDRWASFHHI